MARRDSGTSVAKSGGVSVLDIDFNVMDLVREADRRDREAAADNKKESLAATMAAVSDIKLPETTNFSKVEPRHTGIITVEAKLPQATNYNKSKPKHQGVLKVKATLPETTDFRKKK